VILAPPGRSIFDHPVEVPKVVKHNQCFLKNWSRANIVLPPEDNSMENIEGYYLPCSWLLETVHQEIEEGLEWVDF
jgi:hypothetical protein